MAGEIRTVDELLVDIDTWALAESLRLTNRENR